MTEKLRLFFAVSVPDRHLAAVEDRTRSLRRTYPKARWTPVENQHVTLRFLGWCPSEDLPAVTEAATGVAARCRAADLRLGDVGWFPSPSRMRVLWVGLEDPAGLLASLATGLDEALEPEGFAREERTFTPHLTLARFRAPVRVAEVPTLDLRDLPAFPVSSFELWRSHLSPRGPRYEELATFALSGADAATL